jgi:hypothetical protein
MKFKYSSKDILNDLISMRNFIPQLLDRGKEYDQLLQTLLKLNYFKDENYNSITLKDVSQQTGLKYTTIRKYLHFIYNDLLNHDENHLDFSVHKVEYNFLMHHFDEYAYLTVNYLPVQPKVGEQVNIDFFNAKVGTTSFYVESIHHRMTDEVQIIDIVLHPGLFNNYWQLRKDEAFFKREISAHEYFSNDDYGLQEKLRSKKFL